MLGIKGVHFVTVQHQVMVTGAHKHCDMRASFDFFYFVGRKKRRCVSSKDFRTVGRNSDQIP